MDEFLSGVSRTIARYGMLPPGDAPVIVGVSGGPDSMALLECLALLLGESAGGRIVAAHFDHRIRPESGEDAEFVRGECGRRGLAFFTEAEDVPAKAAREGRGIEEAARNARYAFFERLAKARGATIVALGHNADDNVETVLLNLIRGAGVRGVGGIPPVRPLGPATVVRPLVETGREEIEKFLRARSIEHLTDFTNRDDAYRRNFVRAHVTPLLRRLQPALGTVVARASRAFRETDRWLEREAEEMLGPGELTAGVWREASEAIRPYILRVAAARAGVSALSSVHLEIVGGLLTDGGGETDLPGGLVARFDGSKLAFDAAPAGTGGSAEPWSVPLPAPGEATLSDGRRIRARVFERPPGGEPPRLSDPAAPEWLDYDRLGRPSKLVVRSRRPGDAMRAFGGGTKSIKRLLVDLKVPRAERNAVPVVAGEGVLWVAPFRACEEGRVDSATRTVLELSLIE